MTTALEIISDAMLEIGIKNAETPLEPSEIESGRRKLNNLLGEWDSTGVLKGIAPVEDVGTDLEEERYATEALSSHLATRLASQYNVQVSQSLAISASTSFATMVTAQAQLIVSYPSTLPLGSGNRDNYGAGYDRDYFPENNRRNF